MNDKVFIVGRDHGEDSEPLESREAAEQWAFEHLPYGVLKCRTGSYIILEGTICHKHKEFVEDKTGCESCSEELIENGAKAFCDALYNNTPPFEALDKITKNPYLKRLAYNRCCKQLHDDLINEGYSEKDLLKLKRDIGL